MPYQKHRHNSRIHIRHKKIKINYSRRRVLLPGQADSHLFLLSMYCDGRMWPHSTRPLWNIRNHVQGKYCNGKGKEGKTT